MMITPCKDCPARHPVCHDSCLKYAEFKRQRGAEAAYTREMLETAIRRVGNEYADMLFEYDQQRREAEKQCEQLAMEGMMKK